MRKSRLAIGTTVVVVGLAMPASAFALQITPDKTYQTNGRVSAIAECAGVIYIGGSFTSVRPAGSRAGSNEVPRNHIAALRGSTLLPFNPGANSTVNALAVSSDCSHIYVGGAFSSIAGATRHRFAVLDASGKNLWPDKSVSAKVESVELTPGQVFIGGMFKSVAGVSRTNIAAFDLSTGALSQTFHPTLVFTSDPKLTQVHVLALEYANNHVYAGGCWGSVNGDTTRRNLEAFDPVTGAPDFKFHPGYSVYALDVNSTSLYAAGDGPGGNAFRVELGASKETWHAQTDGGDQTINVIGDTVYIGGHFDNVCSTVTLNGVNSGFKCQGGEILRHKIYAVSTSGSVLSWYPGANSNLGLFSATVTSAGQLAIGGDFTLTGNPNSSGQATYKQQGFAVYSP